MTPELKGFLLLAMVKLLVVFTVTLVGVAYMTEDRRQIGLTMPMSITSNVTLPMLHQYLSRIGLIQRRGEEATAEHYRERLSIRTPSIQQPVAMLSGGNQQKVMLSKWLNTRPQVLILDEPTSALSQAETEALFTTLRRLRARVSRRHLR